MSKLKITGRAGLLIALFLSTFILLGAETDERNRAGLVVAFGNGEVETVCVPFSTAEISGFDLLQQSGLALEMEAQGLGAAVCRIEETGCPAGNCFCQCQGNDCTYWSYWHLVDGVWEYSPAGAGTYRIQSGAVDGWTWGPGSVTEAQEPPLISFADICAEPTPASAASNPQTSLDVEGVGSGGMNWPLLMVAGLIAGGLVIVGMVWRRNGGQKP